ncbi:MAG: response regulator transcription factor [Anaerolineae bacterium]|nr:response regulator transcription factor [Anaerolineae bacterium]
MRDRLSILTDDRALAGFMSRSLEQAGFDVQVLPTAPRYWQRTRRFMSSLLIVDLDTMGAEPLAQCRRLRAVTGATVVAVAEASDEESVLAAFEVGVDEYLKKPISEAELVARVEALFRRLQTAATSASARLPVCRDITLDTATRTLYTHGRRVKLSPTECSLLRCLVRHAGNVVPRDTLLRQISNAEKQPTVGMLTLYIYYLRRKIETDPRHPRHILTRWGVGYCLNVDRPPSSR